MIPAVPRAAVPVIADALADATVDELLHHPARVAQRLAHAFEEAGWHLAPTDAEIGPETDAQPPT